MESNNENTKKLKEGHWYKNSQTNEPIIIDSDLGDTALVQKFIRDKYAPWFYPISFIANKVDIVPLEVTRENLIRFGFILPYYHSFNSDMKQRGKVRVKLNLKSYEVNETDKGIHEIQERYNLKLYLRRL